MVGRGVTDTAAMLIVRRLLWRMSIVGVGDPRNFGGVVVVLTMAFAHYGLPFG